MRVVLTAGFDRALHAVALAELARRAGHEVVSVVIVHALRAERVRQLVRQRGVKSLFDAAKRLVGATRKGSTDDTVEHFLDAHGVRQRSLSAWCRDHGVDCATVSSLNSAEAAELVRSARADGVLYAGGGILRRTFLEAAQGRVLNAHSGPLPRVRGMNACEWSLLLGDEPAVTIHAIDEGIDTGGVLETIPIRVEHGDTISSLRAKCVVAGVEGMLRALPALEGPLPKRPGAADASRQCFTLAPVLRELLDARLAARDRAP